MNMPRLKKSLTTSIVNFREMQSTFALTSHDEAESRNLWRFQSFD